MQEKSLKLRVLSATIGIVLLMTMIWSLGLFATADVPQATLVYDNATQKLLELKDDGTYVESANYSATMKGEGVNLADGYLSAKSLSFTDTTSYIEIKGKNDQAIGSAEGTTVTFWMKKRVTGSQWEPFFSTATETAGDAEATINVDGARYYPDSTATYGYQIRPTKMYGNGTKTVFKSATDWCKFTAVISSEGTKIYHNDTYWYNVSGSTSLEKVGSALSSAPKLSELAAALYNNLMAKDGILRLRGSLDMSGAGTTLYFDELKIFPTALTEAQVSALYDADMAKFVKVTVEPNNGSETTELSVLGGTVPALPTLTYAGHKFVGWFTDEKLTVPYENTAITANTTLYAAWEQTEFTITYHLNGGSLTDPPATYSPEAVTVLPVPTRAGYEFTGWYFTEDLKGSITKTYLNQIGELELYAGWKAIPYTVTYELGGGINHTANPAFVSVETETVQLQPAIRKGYVFDGWYNGDVPVTELTAGEEAITLTAHWKLRTGDTNKDSNMTVYDAVHLLRVICGLDTLGTDADCDYDKNGSLDLADVLLLLQYIDGNGVTLE
ncbi:MAG: InlB B-repeat-containing protein [Clostridia bacterium]|nr:InlB B-repeat-containing protein [Clostridia bacterium]